ncbi:unnamed protein product [Hydatigera taeniaeformis]|uniref:ThiF domain-containing protein n=1 Tax=Hydatigena taeniaeformis TaxID=6205 RepID=A0A0R3WKV2_HYDTA|nr:unnamed protein product [Hydatigera taeniaeformis]
MSIQDISEEEAALYDRQIRLWGLEAQSRLKKTKLLLIGLSPIAAEIIKNIVLCGVDTLTICDDKVRNTSAAKRARTLNEAVTITCEESMSVDFLSNKYQDYNEVIVASFQGSIVPYLLEYLGKLGPGLQKISGLSHRGEPRGNWFFMDGRSCEVAVLWFPVRP